jgi:hypothetical protein
MQALFREMKDVEIIPVERLEEVLTHALKTSETREDSPVPGGRMFSPSPVPLMSSPLKQEGESRKNV